MSTLRTIRHANQNVSSVAQYASLGLLGFIVYQFAGASLKKIEEVIHQDGNRKVWERYVVDKVRQGSFDETLARHSRARLDYKTGLRKDRLPPALVDAIILAVDPRHFGVQRARAVLMDRYCNMVARAVSDRRKEIHDAETLGPHQDGQDAPGPGVHP